MTIVLGVECFSAVEVDLVGDLVSGFVEVDIRGGILVGGLVLMGDNLVNSLFVMKLGSGGLVNRFWELTLGGGKLVERLWGLALMGEHCSVCEHYTKIYV